ncbi:MAG: hypothetical protein V2A34_08955 [Lentisphaerota bacterium]
MPDDIFGIKIQVDKVGSGGAQAGQELDEVTRKANEASSALKSIPDKIDPIAITTSPFDKWRQDLEKIHPQFGKMKEGVSGLNMALRGGPQEAIYGISKAVDSLGGKFSTLAGKGSMLGAALSIGAAAGSTIYKSIITPIWNAIDDGIKAASVFSKEARSKIESLATVKVKFDGIKSGLDEVSKEVDSIIKKMDDVQRRKSQVQGAQDSLDQKSLNLEEKRAMAGAGGNKDIEQSLRQQFEVRRAALELSKAERDTQQQISEASKKLSVLSSERLQYDDRIIQAGKLIAEAEEKYAKNLQTIAAAGFDANAVANDPAARNKAFQEAKSRAEPSLNQDRIALGGYNMDKAVPSANDQALITAIGDLKKSQDSLIQTRSQAEALQKEMTAKLESTGQQIFDLKASLQALGLKMQEIEKDRQLKGIELGNSQVRAMDALTLAIREQQQRVQAAQGNLTAAQAGGSSTEQSAAYQALQNEMAKLSALEQEIANARNQAAASFQAFGTAISQAASLIESGVESGKASIEASGQNVKSAVDAGTADVAAATTVVADATSASLSSLAGQINTWGTKTVDMFSGLTNSLSTVVSRMNSMDASISQIGRLADNASTNASMALAQIRNMR